MAKKIILILIGIVFVLGVVVYQFFLKEEKPKFATAKVLRGTVVKEVSETGTVKITDNLELGFKNSGRIKKIYIEVGDIVEKGEKLAELDTDQLFIQLQEAKAALEVARADYNKLLAGSSPEEIKVAEAALYNAQVVLKNAQQNLKDVEAEAKEDLKQAYEDALNILDAAFLKIYNAYTVVDDIQRDYFNSNDQEGIKVKEAKDKIERAMNESETYIEEAKNNPLEEKIDKALSETENRLKEAWNALGVIREATETVNYQDTVSSSDKTSLDNQKEYINTAHTNIVNAQQTITKTKVSNQKNINAAQAQVTKAQAELKKKEEELALKKAEPRQEDIDLYQAKIRQAESQVSLLEAKIRDATIISPESGQIIEINKKEGETVQPTDSVISFLPSGPFQVKVDIYEEDIPWVKIDKPVKITLPAFPGEIFKGRVVSVNPAEKIIEGVVYYEVAIDFQNYREGIKQGMTADIVIESDKRENVLAIPEEALEEVNGTPRVRVFKDKEVEEREIKIGLKGSNGLVEVLSGLSEGERVITGKNL